ncbi:tetratricopeptide repeat protein [Leucobacter coleopterorum]|uniref:Tetratricopeptide repeat protein n=1 Tax=Leucobacter coleopterorum TaxID=2714933 RepID=A0ABX6K3V6_9MICO|nr:tetratricopeptide repeat protein [Leucobacter coleopterorum]
MLQKNRRRRRARKWIGISAIPIVLIAALLVLKLLSMYAFAHQSIRSFVATDFEGTVSAAEWQGVANWFEPYKAPYNRGTGLAELGELDKARAALEEALPLVSGLEVCAVRYNLATVVERQGDRATGAGDLQKGQELYRKALEILSAAPKECGTAEADAASPDHQRPMKESLEELVRRIMEKLIQEPQDGQSQDQDQQQPQEPQEPQQGEQEPKPNPQDQEPNDSQLDEIEKKLKDGAQQRQDRDQGKSDGGFGGGTDRPW